MKTTQDRIDAIVPSRSYDSFLRMWFEDDPREELAALRGRLVDEAEAAQIDAVVEHCRDIKEKYQKAKTDPEQKAAFFAKEMPGFMQKMDKAVSTVSLKGGPGIIGSSLSLADVTLFVFIKDFFDDKDLAAASIAKCPRLLASIKATGENPGIAAYRAKRDAKSSWP